MDAVQYSYTSRLKLEESLNQHMTVSLTRDDRLASTTSLHGRESDFIARCELNNGSQLVCGYSVTQIIGGNERAEVVAVPIVSVITPLVCMSNNARAPELVMTLHPIEYADRHPTGTVATVAAAVPDERL